MAVLVEAISVVIQNTSLERSYRGGVSAFAEFCRGLNNSFCTDGELARMGFTRSEDVGKFVERVGLLGLVHVRQGRAIDFVVADQRSGLLQRCDWADFGFAQLPLAGPPKVAACRLKGTSIADVTVPEGWRYEKSISREVARADAEEARWAKTSATGKSPLVGLSGAPAMPPIADLLGLTRRKT